MRLEQLGVSPNELARKKTNRRLLFTGISVILVLIFAVLAVVVRSHQQQVDGENYSEAFGIASLENLNDATNVSAGCEITMMLIRHCEKEGAEVSDQDGNQHCSYIGLERAHFLPTLFGPGGWPVPSLLYALAPKRGHHMNFREVETVVPLADEFGLQIYSDYQTNDDLAHHFFKKVASGEMCGKTAIAAWKHDMIGDLARKLGCHDCPGFFPDQFDEVWQLKYVYDVEGTALIQQKHGIQKPNVRTLRKKHAYNPDGRSWSVYSTVTSQHFDPLKFSYSIGDYDGSPSGGKWFAADEGAVDEGEM
jgi:hypothetical protein